MATLPYCIRPLIFYICNVMLNNMDRLLKSKVFVFTEMQVGSRYSNWAEQETEDNRHVSQVTLKQSHSSK